MPDPTKAPYHLLPWDILVPFTYDYPHEFFDGIARVLDFGATKYGHHTFEPFSKAVVLDHLSAYYRHMARWNYKELRDAESGLGHYHHASARLLILAMVASDAMLKNQPIMAVDPTDGIGTSEKSLKQTIYGDWTSSHSFYIGKHAMEPFCVSKMQPWYDNKPAMFRDAYNVYQGALGLLHEHASLAGLRSVAETSKPPR